MNPNGTVTAPWDTSCLTLIDDPVVTPTWSLWAHTTATPYWVEYSPAWDIVVDLDERRTPYGTCEFSLPASYADHAEFSPFTGSEIEIRAGWLHTIGGTPTDEQHTLFYGVVTSRELVKDPEGGTHVRIKAATGEVNYDHPVWTGAYDVRNDLTTVVDACDSIDENGHLIRPISVQATDLNTPTADRLAVFRAIRVDAGDNVDDFVHNIADALGQWARGNQRGTYLANNAYQISRRYTGSTRLNLTPIVETYRRAEDVDDWANVVELTATWVSSGETKRSTYTYIDPVLAALPPGATRFVRVKKATIQARPFLVDGVRKLTADWPTGTAYLNAALRRTWQTTITARAVWWLEPCVSVQAHDDDGSITRINFQVDRGTMTLTLRPDNLTT